MYLNEVDSRVLLAWLASTSEIGFLVPDGASRWKAVREISGPPDHPLNVWHVPSGPLPLLGERREDPAGQIDSPWEGWFERRPGTDTRLPYFGAGHPGVFTLTFRLQSKRTWEGHKSIRQPSNAVGLSSAGWIGNRYRMIGNAAKPETETFWKKLRKFVASQATKIPRVGPLEGPYSEVFAFRSVLTEIQNGRPRAANPE
jgi:hypothetical protein